MPTCHTPMHSANLESMTGCCRSMRTAGKLACGEALAARHQALAARHQHPLHAQSHAHRERKIAKQQQSTQIACACRTACACLECGRARSGLLKVLRQALSGAESSERRERHRSTGRQQESCARGEQASSARESESKSETLGREPRWEGGGDREGGTEQDLTELGAAALTTAALRLLWGHRETFCALSSGRQMRHCRRSRLCSQNCDPPHVLHVPVCVHAHVSRACIRTCTPGLNRRMRIHICVHAHEACGVACARKHARKHVHAPMQALGYTHACKQRSPATCASAAMLARMYAAEKARRRGQPARRAHASPRAAPRNSDGGKMA